MIGLAMLAACATPQERCVNRETRTYRMTQTRVTGLELDLARGYSLVEESVSRRRWVRCGGGRGGDKERGGGRERPQLCLDEYDTIVTKRVRIDAEVVQAELGVLKARLAKLRAPTEAAMAQCRIDFPAET